MIIIRSAIVRSALSSHPHGYASTRDFLRDFSTSGNTVKSRCTHRSVTFSKINVRSARFVGVTFETSKRDFLTFPQVKKSRGKSRDLASPSLPTGGKGRGRGGRTIPKRERTTTTNTNSPNLNPFGPAGYPHAGHRTGPAWRALLTTTEHGNWIDQLTAMDAMETAGPIARKTAANLIAYGVRHGFLERHHIPGSSNPRKYRIRRKPESGSRSS